MQLLHIDIISGFLLILGVESIAHKFVDHKGKGKVEYQTNNNEDGDDFNVGDTPDDMKLKIPRISGQGDSQSGGSNPRPNLPVNFKGVSLDLRNWNSLESRFSKFAFPYRLAAVPESNPIMVMTSRQYTKDETLSQ